MSDVTLINPTRVCTINFLNVLIETQKNNLIKNEMLRPIVSTVFSVMCQSEQPLQTKSNVEIELLGEGIDENVDDTENLFTAATQVLDYCALYFPAKKFVKTLVEFVSPAVMSIDPLHRRAAFAALAITAEGCADYYRNHYLELLVDLCLKGMRDNDTRVVQIAYFALCQFSEFFQPSLAPYADRIMQLFIEAFEANIELMSINRLTVRFYDALQSFCENLGEDLEPFLPTLMNRLSSIQVHSHKLQRLVVSTFSSVVCSVKRAFNPYFDSVVEIIKPYLSYGQAHTNLDSKFLQIECIGRFQ